MNKRKIAPAPKQPKIIANDNNKFACNAFSYIGPPPKVPMMASMFPIALNISDGVCTPFLCYLVDCIRVTAGKIPSTITIPAYGIAGWEWRKGYFSGNPMSNMDTELCVYFLVKENGSGPPEWAFWDSL